MSKPRLYDLRAITVLVLASLSGLAPTSARGQFATLLDTTARYAGGSAGLNTFNGDTGAATAKNLNVPSSVVFDSQGNLFISDSLNNCVRKIDTSGNVTTVAGLRINGNPTDTCDTTTLPGPDPTFGLVAPTGLAIDKNDVLYIADNGHNCVRSLASGAVDSYATPMLVTVAGVCTFVNTDSVTPVPIGIAVDGSSNLYISIVGPGTGVAANQVVRHLAADPPTTICAMAGDISIYAATTMCAGAPAGIVLSRPAGLAVDRIGNLFIADSDNDCVREIVGMTTAQTVVGQCNNDNTGSLTTALHNPYGLGFSVDASLFITEAGANHNNLMTYNSGSNTLTAVAGLASGAAGGYNVAQEGQSALMVPLNEPLGVSSDSAGNIYLADSQNNVVRKMGKNLTFPDTNVMSTSASQTLVFGINQAVNLTTSIGADYNIVSTTCTGALASGSSCQVAITFGPTRPGARYSPLKLTDSISGRSISVALEGMGIGPQSLMTPGVASTRGAGLRSAVAVTTNSAGDTYVLEQGNNTTTADVLLYPAGGGAAQVVVAQGTGLVSPTAMAVDGGGNIFVYDSALGSIIRFGVDGTINTAYASGGMSNVNSMAIDGFGDLFLAMGGAAHNVTEIYAGGTRRVVAGNGATSSADGILATNASFYDPTGVAVGPNGLSIADSGTHSLVYTIDSAGTIHIVAGNGTTTTTTPGVATGTGLLTPSAIAVDAAGDIYIADNSANIVYEVFPVLSNGVNIKPVLGTGVAGYTGDGGPSTSAAISSPVGITLDGSSGLFQIDPIYNVLREVTYPTNSNINFGNVLIGTTSAPIPQFFANAGNANLTFTIPFTTTDAHYGVSANPTYTNCAATMALGSVCSLGYTYAPTAPQGGSTALAIVPTNSYNSSQIVHFSGYGYPTMTLPATWNPETEVYGYAFTQSVALAIATPPGINPTGSMVFSVGALTTCTISGPFTSTVNCAAANSGLAVGAYTVDYTYTSGDTNYLSTTGTVGLTVTQAPLTVDVNNATRAYGAADPTFTGTVTGVVNGDTLTVTYSTTATATSPVGTYLITATVTGANSGSYIQTINAGTLTITQAATPLVVTVNNASRAYGAANPSFTGNVANALNGDTFTITYSTTATATSAAGPYLITASVTGAAAANYSISVVAGTLTVTPATGLTITVNNATRAYGTTNPTFSGTVTGLLNGDTVTVNYSTTATVGSYVGGYPITATISGAAAGNYSLTVVPGTLTITQATTPLNVIINNDTRVYGAANPTFTSSITNALNGDTFTITYSTTATAASPIGPYPINATVSGAAAASYATIQVFPGILTVTQASGGAGLVVTINNASRAYGTTNPSFTSSIVGAVNGDTFTVTYSTGATVGSYVGGYPITATVSGANVANYTVTVVPGTLTITQATAPLVVLVNNDTRAYGTANPVFSGSTTGQLNGDTFTINYSSTATVGSYVGGYPITAAVTGAAAANYNVTVLPGTLTITQALTPVVVTVNNATRMYGAANPAFTSGIANALNGDTFTLTYSTAATVTSPIGAYSLTTSVSGAAAANYATITVVPATLTITQASGAAGLVVTVNSASRAYGTANPTFTSTITGAVNGDTFTVTYSTGATITSPVGPYPITATVTGANLANYSYTVVPGTLTITQATAPLTVTVNSATRAYGTANPAFTGTTAGLLNGDTVTVTYSTAATVGSYAGTYPITATVTGTAAANYNVTVVPGTLTITKATTPLVVTVNNATRPYGTANPTFTSTTTGALNGDTFTIIYTTTATTGSPLGTYPISATVSGAAAASYNVTATPGTLTITTATAPLVVTVNNVARAFGASNPTFTSTITGALNGDTFTVAYATTATAASVVANYPITATVTGANLSNYTLSVVPGTLSVVPATTVTALASSANPTNQGTNVTFTATVTSASGVPTGTVDFFNGTTLISSGTLNASGVVTTSISSLLAGSYTITANYSGATNFAVSSGTVTQVISTGTYSVAATPSSQFIRGPGTTVYAVTVSSAQGFIGPVTLSCSGLPADATCTFGTPSANLKIGDTLSTTMTVVTTQADAKMHLPSLGFPAGKTPNSVSPIAFAAVFPFGLGAFFAGMSRRRRGVKAGIKASRSPKIRLLMALLCTAGIISLAGCSCFTSIYQTYTIPITATSTVSGTTAQTTSVTLTVAQQ